MENKDARTGIWTTRNGRREEIRIQHPDWDMLDIYASWTPQQRIRAVDEMMRSARKMLSSAIHGEHPEWTEEQVRREVARRILGHDL